MNHCQSQHVNAYRAATATISMIEAIRKRGAFTAASCPPKFADKSTAQTAAKISFFQSVCPGELRARTRFRGCWKESELQVAQFVTKATLEFKHRLG